MHNAFPFILLLLSPAGYRKPPHLPVKLYIFHIFFIGQACWIMTARNQPMLLYIIALNQFSSLCVSFFPLIIEVWYLIMSVVLSHTHARISQGVLALNRGNIDNFQELSTSEKHFLGWDFEAASDFITYS